MYCPKQGLKHYKVALYQSYDGQENDFTSKPRPSHNLYLVCGNAEFKENGSENTVTVSAGDYIFIAKGGEYRARWYGAEPVRFMTVHFDFEWQNDPLKNKIIRVQTVKGNTTSEEKKRYLYQNAP